MTSEAEKVDASIIDKVQSLCQKRPCSPPQWEWESDAVLYHMIWLWSRELSPARHTGNPVYLTTDYSSFKRTYSFVWSDPFLFEAQILWGPSGYIVIVPQSLQTNKLHFLFWKNFQLWNAQFISLQRKAAVTCILFLKGVSQFVKVWQNILIPQFILHRAGQILPILPFHPQPPV